MSASFMRKLALGTAAAVALVTLTAGCGSHASKAPPAGGTSTHKTSGPNGGGSAF
jgi:outer membrane lipopolysaccharide assembly protein LptE/RlpB